MSPRVPPRPLQEQALSVIATEITCMITVHGKYCSDQDDLSEISSCAICRHFRDYWRVHLAATLRTKLLVLVDRILHANGRKTCMLFRLLLADDITDLVLGVSSDTCFMYEQCKLGLIQTYGTGLVSVDIIAVNPELMTELHLALASLKRVQTLYLPEEATDNTMAVIGQHCHQLRVLKLGFMHKITDAGVINLCVHKEASNPCCETLQVVENLGNSMPVFGADMNSPITSKGIAFLLTHAKNLVAMPSCIMPIGRVLSQTCGITKLHALEDHMTDLETLHAIAKVCPRLRAFVTDSPEDHVLQEMHCLANVTQVTIAYAETGDIHEYLKRHGRFLQQLEINEALGVIEFEQLSRCCPNLDSLRCFATDLSCCTGVVMHKLTSLFLDANHLEYDMVLAILKLVPNLEELLFFNIFSWSEAQQTKCVAKLPKSRLRKLQLSTMPKLSIDCLTHLVENAPNLTHIRFYMPGVSSEECRQLRKFKEELRKRNCQIQINNG